MVGAAGVISTGVVAIVVMLWSEEACMSIMCHEHASRDGEVRRNPR
jgi:hypothetical protein